MINVEFKFVTPEGVPIGLAEFFVQPLRPSYDDDHTGVVMPREVYGTTDADGECTLSLWPSTVPYIVVMDDVVSDVGLSYRFVVPDTPGETYRLQDIVIAGELTIPWDQQALLDIQAAKAATGADRIATNMARDQAVAAAAGIGSAVTDAQAYAADTLTNRNQASGFATSADNSAQAAATSASQAAGSASSASGSANVASGHADSAGVYAQQSQTARDQSTASATASEGHRVAAGQYASDANTSKVDAAQSATQAGLSEQAAGESAVAATGSALAASGSATAASNSQGAAAGSATAAAGSATTAGQFSASAEDSAEAAAGSATDALSSANASAGSASAAAGSAGAANSSATNAATARTAAENARDTAVQAALDSIAAAAQSGVKDAYLSGDDLIVVLGDDSEINVGSVRGLQGPQGAGIVAKGAVPTVGDLPAVGNQLNDAWVVQATGHLYVWSGSSWTDLGQFKGDPGTTDYNLLSNKPVLGTAAALNTGTGAGNVILGNDARLTNARTPTAHTHVLNDISDLTVMARSLLDAVNGPAVRTLIGAGTSSLGLGTTGTTALAGNYIPPRPSQGEAEAGTSNVVYMTPLRTAQAIAALAPQGFSGAYAELSGLPTLGTAAAANLGTGANDAIKGDDARLTNARTPTAHTHAVNGLDGITATGIAVATAVDGFAVRTAIGAGTSNLAVGTTSADAKAGNWVPSWADVTNKPTVILSGATGKAAMQAAGFTMATDVVLATNSEGNPTQHALSATATASSVAMRTADGRLKVATATESGDAVTLAQLNANSGVATGDVINTLRTLSEPGYVDSNTVLSQATYPNLFALTGLRKDVLAGSTPWNTSTGNNTAATSAVWIDNDRILSIGSNVAMRSLDKGLTWSAAGAHTSLNIRNVIRLGTNTVFFQANASGSARITLDSGDTFLAVTQAQTGGANVATGTSLSATSGLLINQSGGAIKVDWSTGTPVFTTVGSTGLSGLSAGISYIIAKIGNRIFVAGNGSIAISKDEGVTWTIYSLVGTETSYSLQAVGNVLLLASASVIRRNIQYGTGGGNSWPQVAAVTTSSGRLFPLGGNTVIYVPASASNPMFISYDAGLSWDTFTGVWPSTLITAATIEVAPDKSAVVQVGSSVSAQRCSLAGYSYNPATQFLTPELVAITGVNTKIKT